eukprot:6213574-Pleurochrysis_carterae.AAC.7
MTAPVCLRARTRVRACVLRARARARACVRVHVCAGSMRAWTRVRVLSVDVRMFGFGVNVGAEIGLTSIAMSLTPLSMLAPIAGLQARTSARKRPRSRSRSRPRPCPRPCPRPRPRHRALLASARTRTQAHRRLLATDGVASKMGSREVMAKALLSLNDEILESRQAWLEIGQDEWRAPPVSRLLPLAHVHVPFRRTLSPLLLPRVQLRAAVP